MNKDCLLEIKSAIKNKDIKLMRDISLKIEEYMLDKNIFPDDCFNILISLFSDEGFCAASGADEFVWIVYNDFDKLSNIQSKILFDLFTKNFSKFTNKEFLHSVSDFIARKYHSEDTLKVFHNMSIKKDENSRYAALVGLEILKNRKKRKIH